MLPEESLKKFTLLSLDTKHPALDCLQCVVEPRLIRLDVFGRPTLKISRERRRTKGEPSHRLGRCARAIRRRRTTRRLLVTLVSGSLVGERGRRHGGGVTQTVTSGLVSIRENVRRSTYSADLDTGVGGLSTNSVDRVEAEKADWRRLSIDAVELDSGVGMSLDVLWYEKRSFG